MVTDTFQLIDAVKQMYPVAQFLKDRYFPDGKNFYSSEVMIDSKKQGRQMAPFVIPKINGIVMESEAMRTDRIKAPTIAPKTPITPEDLEKRGFGESPDSNRAPADRERELEADILDEHRNAISRRLEQMCADIITTGQVTIKQYATAEDAAADKNAQERVLQYFDSTFGNRFVTSKKWNNMTAQEKVDTLYKMASELHKRGFKATDLVITADVAAGLFADPDFLDYFDKRRVEIGNIAPIETPEGVVYNGSFVVHGVTLSLFTYDEWFAAADGTLTRILPANTIAMLTPGMGKTVYGQVTFLEGTGENAEYKSYAEKFVPRAVANITDNVKDICLFSRPVPYPVFTDSWLYVDADRNN